MCKEVEFLSFIEIITVLLDDLESFLPIYLESLRDKLPDTTAIQCPKWVYDDDDYK